MELHLPVLEIVVIENKSFKHKLPALWIKSSVQNNVAKCWRDGA